MKRMQMFLCDSVTLALVSLTLLHVSTAADWSYTGEHGPASWQNHYHDCGGRRQSPINIHTNAVTVAQPQHKIKWMFYNKNPVSMTLANNGHSVQLKATPKTGKAPYLIVDSKTFELDQTHFHWGKKNSEGSEHRIDGQSYPLEMHAVHRLVKDGHQVSPQEVIVITILFETSKQKNPGLERFLHHVTSVKGAETNVTIPPFPADTLIPTFTNYYYKYEGSLTTPPCSEVVTFYIREELAKVSTDQLEMLRVALNEEKEEISGNFRTPQPLNGRTIYRVTK